MPPFQEKDVDAYFETFEHTASTLKWPPDCWSILLATVIKNKAQTAYASLDPVEKGDYQIVKSAILQAYELVPEAHRHGFRTLKGQEGQNLCRLLERERKTL